MEPSIYGDQPDQQRGALQLSEHVQRNTLRLAEKLLRRTRLPLLGRFEASSLGEGPRSLRLCQNSVLVGHDHKMQRMRFQLYVICGHDFEFRNSLVSRPPFFYRKK